MGSKLSRWIGLGLLCTLMLLGRRAGLRAQSPAAGAGDFPVVLSVDKGCGASYQPGETLRIIYQVLRDALVTLRVRGPDGSERVLFADRPAQTGVPYQVPATVTDNLGPRLFTLEAVAGTLHARAECTFQVSGNISVTADTVALSGNGTLLDVHGRPAAGATVQISNDPPDGRSFRLFADSHGTFRFVNLPLTPMVRFHVSSDAFHQIVGLQLPRERLQGEGNDFVLDPVVVSLSGKVVVHEGSQDQPVPSAVVFTVRDQRTEPLCATNEAGDLTRRQALLEELGSARQATLRVELPDALTLFGRFEPGPQAVLKIDPIDGVVDLGVVRFRRVSNPESMVRLAGFLGVVDELEPSKSKGIEGLVLRALDARRGQAVAETVTRAGRWSMTIPKGEYSFTSPNAADLGFQAPPPDVYRIEFGREDLQNDLDRFVPKIVSLESQKLAFTYPDIPNLPVQQVVLRVNEQVVDLVSSVGRDGSRYVVMLTRPLQPGASVQVAVRIDGLLTRFSSAQTL